MAIQLTSFQSPAKMRGLIIMVDVPQELIEQSKAVKTFAELNGLIQMYVDRKIEEERHKKK